MVVQNVLLKSLIQNNYCIYPTMMKHTELKDQTELVTTLKPVYNVHNIHLLVWISFVLFAFLTTCGIDGSLLIQWCSRDRATQGIEPRVCFHKQSVSSFPLSHFSIPQKNVSQLLQPRFSFDHFSSLCPNLTSQPEGHWLQNCIKIQIYFTNRN